MKADGRRLVAEGILADRIILDLSHWQSEGQKAKTK